MKLGIREIILFSFVLLLILASKSFGADSNFYYDYLGFSRAKAGTRKVRIAILDNGFGKWQDSKILPAETKYIEPVVAIENQEDHGLKLSEFLVNYLRLAKVDFELTLAPTYGYSNLVNAVQKTLDVDVILYAQVWEYGGNGDGRGFINKAIEPALSNGVTWINAAGNFGLSTYSTLVRPLRDGWLKLPGHGNTVRLRCEQKGGCDLRAVLSWNDFKDDVALGTDKDLDLVLLDDTNTIIQTSALKQTLGDADQPGFSKYPREILTSRIVVGNYFLRVKSRSESWTDSDKLRITVSNAKLLDVVSENTVLPPADNLGVITVGALDTRTSGVSATKPDLWSPSVLLSSDQFGIGFSAGTAGDASVGQTSAAVEGSSISATLLTAAVAVLKSNDEFAGADRAKILERLKPRARLPAYANCLNLVSLSPMPRGLFSVLQNGSWIVQTPRGREIFLPEDPVLRIHRLGENISGLTRNQTAFWTTNGFVIGQMPSNPAFALPLVQTGENQPICGQRPTYSYSSFSL